MGNTEDHYAALGIAPTCTVDEIREAFRRLAKQHHPDKNRGNEAEARARFERIVAAYQVLVDPRARLLYDRRYVQRPEAPHGRPARPATPADTCQQMFDLLLTEQAEEALVAFDRLLSAVRVAVPDLDLPVYLDYTDARDCEFLLAEALERNGRPEDAIALYERSLQREAIRPYFRAFTEEIHDRLKRLYFDRVCQRIEAGTWEGPVTDALDAVFALGVTRRERAHYYKSLAEALERSGGLSDAREALLLALKLVPKLAGVKKLSRRLNLGDAGVASAGDGLGSARREPV